MILKYLNQLLKSWYSSYRRYRRKRIIIEALKTENFKLRYALINLCMLYANEGMKPSRFLHRVNKNARLLKRRELHLKRLQNKM